MTDTKLTLIGQTDQTLDTAQVKTKIVLKNLSTDKALNLTYTQPAGTNRTVNFPDPGADDTIVYANNAQTLTNKTIVGGTIPDQPQYAHLSGQAGGQNLRGGTAASENLSLSSTTHATKGNIVVGSAENIILSGGGEVKGLPSTPSGNTAAASKAYVDSQATFGKELLIVAAQLDNTHKAFAQASVFYLVGQPVSGDIFSISDGSTTENYTYAGGASAFHPAVGATVIDAMTSLAARINADSAVWSAVESPSLSSLNQTTNDVVVIWRKIPTFPATDRIYGNFSSSAQSNAQYVNYNSQPDYRSSLGAQLPASDPGVVNFGVSRVTGDLVPDETHLVRLEDTVYYYDSDGGVWIVGSGTVPVATAAPGGGVLGQATFNSSLGLAVAAGVTSVKIDGSSITFDGSGRLQSAAGAVPVATAASGGGVQGKVTADSDFGLSITAGVMKVNAQTGASGSIKYTGGVLTASAREYYLSSYAFGNPSGTTFNTTSIYPTLGSATNTTDILYSIASVAAGSGSCSLVFEGRMGTFQTQVTNVKLDHKLLSGSPTITLNIYFEGANSPVSTQSITPTGTLTEVSVTTSGFTQPTGSKRIFVEVICNVTAVASIGVSAPFVRME